MKAKLVLKADEELWREVKSKAALEGKTIEDMVRTLIKKGLCNTAHSMPKQPKSAQNNSNQTLEEST